MQHSPFHSSQEMLPTNIYLDYLYYLYLSLDSQYNQVNIEEVDMEKEEKR